jgi:hypothetical protein
VRPVLLLLATILPGHAQSRVPDTTSNLDTPGPTNATVHLEAGPLRLDIYISETAQLFHVVDQISQWSEFSHRQYVRYFRSTDGGLTEADRQLLAEHAAIRKAHGWGKGPERVFYTMLDLDEALRAGVVNGHLTDGEAETERRVLLHFQPRVRQLIASEGGHLSAFVRELGGEQSDLAAFAAEAARFVGASPANAIPFYPIVNPDDINMGGGFNGGTLTLEIPRTRNAYPTLLHELFHAFVQTRKATLEAAVRTVPGLDFETLNEGLAYAMSPGIHHSGDADQLQESVVGFMAKRMPLSDSYTRFNSFALALRPLLKEALADPKQNLDSFLPRAADAWLVLTELDHARGLVKQ